MTTRSRRLVDPYSPPDGFSHIVYSVPSDRFALVKSFRIVNLTGSAQLFDICVNVHDAAHALFWRATVPAASVVSDSTWWVAEPDDELIVKTDAGDVCTFWASGAELPL